MIMELFSLCWIIIRRINLPKKTYIQKYIKTSLVDEVQTIRQIHLFSNKPPNILRKEEYTQWVNDIIIIMEKRHEKPEENAFYLQSKQFALCTIHTKYLHVSFSFLFCMSVSLLFPYFPWCLQLWGKASISCVMWMCIVTFIKCLVIDFLTIFFTVCSSSAFIFFFCLLKCISLQIS